LNQITGYTDIQSAVILARQNINRSLFFHYATVLVFFTGKESALNHMDSRLRGNDGKGALATFGSYYPLYYPY
jgi:hypothetical protein